MEATVGVAEIGGVDDGFSEKAESNKESNCEVMLAAMFGFTFWGLVSVDTVIASVFRSSGINDAIASVSSCGGGLVTELADDSDAVEFCVVLAAASLLCTATVSAGGVSVLGGSSKSVKLDSGNGLIGVSSSTWSEASAASGSKN